MSRRALTTTLLAFAVLHPVPRAGAEELCHSLFVEEATCDLSPGSGACEGLFSAIIGGNLFTLEFTRVDLGAPLSVDADGSVRGVASEETLVRETGVRFATFGEAVYTPTDDPAVLSFVERTDLVAANRAYDSGVLVATGQVDLTAGTASGTISGRLCRSPHLP